VYHVGVAWSLEISKWLSIYKASTMCPLLWFWS